MFQAITELLEAAESNLARYIESGDERAINAGRGMVEDLRAELAALSGAA